MKNLLLRSTKQIIYMITRSILILVVIGFMGTSAYAQITGVTPSSRCGEGTLVLHATAGSGTITWYEVPFYGTAITAGISDGGATFTTPSLEVTKTYYVDALDEEGCSLNSNNARVLVIATISANSIQAIIFYSSNTFCKSIVGPQEVTRTGTAGGVYTVDPSGLTLDEETGAITPSSSTEGTYTVTYTVVPAEGCVENPASTSVTITTAPIQPTISYSGSPYCTTHDPVTVTQTGATGGSYSAVPSGLTINAASGTITPSSSFQGDYTITYFVPGTGGCSPLSTTANISINSASVGGTATAAYSPIPAGDNTTISLSGYNGAIQWQTNASSSWVDIDGEHGVIYTTPVLTVTTSYRAVVTNGVCSSANSTTATVTVNAVSEGGTASADPQTICYSFTSELTLTGYIGTIQWQTDATGSFVDINGATSANYTTPALTENTSYRAVVTNGVSQPDISNEVLITVIPTSIGGSVNGTTICSGNAAVLQLAEYTGAIQWQIKVGESFENIVGEISDTYITANLTTTTIYRAMVTNTPCVAAYSNEATVTVETLSQGGTATATVTIICSGGSTTITLTGYNGTIQWQTNASGSFVDINKANSETYDTPELTATTKYRAVVTNGTCLFSNSTEATVTVVADPTLSQPDDVNICLGGSTVLTTLASGGTGTYSYQWQYCATSGGTYENVENGTPSGITYSGGTGTALTISGDGTEAIAAKYYKCLLATNTPSGAGCDAITGAVTVTTVEDPAITTEPSSPAAICVGGTTADMIIAAANGTPSLTYKWQYYNEGAWGNVVDGTPAGSVYTGAQGTAFSVAGISAAGTYDYKCIVSASASGCGDATSNTVTVTVVADPSISVHPVSPDDVCVGGTLSALTVTASNGTPSLTYQWYSNVANSNSGGTNLGSGNGAQTDSYTPPTATAGTLYYYCVVSATGSGCEGAASSTAKVTVAVDPSWTNYSSPTPTTLCHGGTVAFSVSVIGGLGGEITWIRSDTPGGAGTTVTTGDIPGVGTWYYRPHYAPTGEGCDLADGTETEVVVNPIPDAPTGDATQSFYIEDPHTVAELTATGSNIQWYAAETGGSPKLPTETLVTATHYWASQTLINCESSERFDVTVTLNPVKNSTLGTNYPTIQEAIDDVLTQDEHIILVADGTYNLVTPVNVTKEVTITGDIVTPAHVIVNAPDNADLTYTTTGNHSCFLVSADNVTIQGFTLQNANDYFTAPYNTSGTFMQNWAIFIGYKFNGASLGTYYNDIDHINIKNNVIKNSSTGIHLYNNDYVNIENNTIQDITLGYSGTQSGGSGIVIYNSSSTGPTGYDATTGHYILKSNIIHDCDFSGITINVNAADEVDWVNLTGSTIELNTIYDNYSNLGTGWGGGYAGLIGGFGIRGWEQVQGLEISGNEIYGNVSTDHSYAGCGGIRISGSNALVVDDNDVYNNERGIYLGASTATTTSPDVTNNVIYGNVHGVYIAGTATDVDVNTNKIYSNTTTGLTNMAAAEVDALNNWWGQATGPTIATNPCGTGDNVSTNVTYEPWYTDAALTSLTGTVLNAGLTVGGPGSVCTGTGTNITVALSQTGVNYQLRNDAGDVNVGTAVPGTGGTINLPTGNLTIATTFNVYATHATTGCSVELTETESVTIDALPTATISGSTTVCSGSTVTLSVALTGQANWSITWTDGTTPTTVNNIATSPYTFDVYPTANTTYTITNVTDGNGCSNTGSGSAFVNIGPRTTAAVVTNVCPGTIIEVPVKITDFYNISAISLKLIYDKSVMTFNSYDDNSNLIDYCTADESGTDGILTISGMPGTPADLANNAILLTIKFNFISGTTNLTWDNSPDIWCEYGSGVSPDFVPYCDNPDGTYYINGSVTGYPVQAAPAQAAHTPSQTQIVWNWSAASGATGYKWNTTNDYGGAIDMLTAVTKTETGLTCNTAETSYVWAYNASGCVSGATTLSQTTSSCGSGDAIYDALTTSQASYSAASANSLVKVTSAEYAAVLTALSASAVGYTGTLDNNWATECSGDDVTFSYNANSNESTIRTFSASYYPVALSFHPALNPAGSYSCQLKYNDGGSLSNISSYYSGATTNVNDRQYFVLKTPSQLPNTTPYISLYTTSGIATTWATGNHYWDWVSGNPTGAQTFTSVTGGDSQLPSLQVLQTATKQWP